jgi:hypothetical protein
MAIHPAKSTVEVTPRLPPLPAVRVAHAHWDSPGWTAGYTCARTGEFSRGLETCRRARALATDPLHQAWADVTIGVVHVEVGDAGQAIAHLDRGLRVFIAGFRAGEQWFQLSRAELDLAGVLDACGRHAGARELAAAARHGFATQGNAHWIRRTDVALARQAATGGS